MGFISNLINLMPGMKAKAEDINDNNTILVNGHNNQETRINDLENSMLSKLGFGGGQLEGALHTAGHGSVLTNNGVATLNEKSNIFFVSGPEDFLAFRNWTFGLVVVIWNNTRTIRNSGSLVLQNSVDKLVKAGDISLFYIYPQDVAIELNYFPHTTEKSTASLVGDFVFTSKKIPDDGMLKTNGAAILRANYPDLFNFATANNLIGAGLLFGPGDGSTTFNVPNFSGTFLRCFDDGAGVDPSRIFGSAQANANSFFKIVSYYGADYTSYKTGSKAGYNCEAGDYSDILTYVTNGYRDLTKTNEPGHATESRPINVAVNCFIRWK